MTHSCSTGGSFARRQQYPSSVEIVRIYKITVLCCLLHYQNLYRKCRFDGILVLQHSRQRRCVSHPASQLTPTSQFPWMMSLLCPVRHIFSLPMFQMHIFPVNFSGFHSRSMWQFQYAPPFKKVSV